MDALKAIILFLIFFGLLGSCTRTGCSALKEKPANTVSNKSQTSLTTTEIKDFPNLNFTGLSDEQKNGFIKLLNDEICPCGCPKTFAQCILKEKECTPGTLLARWGIEQLKAGAPERMLFQVLSEEINTGYMARQISIKTEGAAHKGNASAPITIVEFADFECPACKIGARAISQLIKEKGDQIQLYFMHFPLSIHPQAEEAAIFAEAAGKQGKFWPMHDMLFAHEGPLTDDVLMSFAKKLFPNKKNFEQFQKDRKDQSLLDKIKANKEYALNELRLIGTPSFFFNGRLYNLSLNEDGFSLRIAMEQARTGIRCEDNKEEPK